MKNFRLPHSRSRYLDIAGHLLYNIRMKLPHGTINLSGRRFGHLLATRYLRAGKHGPIWECRCDCGRTVPRHKRDLLAAGPNASCGCVTPASPNWVGARGANEDYTGRTFGWITIVGRAANNRGRAWRCKCKCGTEYVLRTSNLPKRPVHPEYNCGCKPVGYNPGGMTQVAKNIKASQLRVMAKRRKIQVSITNQEIYALIDQPCHYCGRSGVGFVAFKSGPYKGQEYRCNGIDRLDSSKGYESGNVVPCCSHCNEGKMDRTQEEYVAHCRRVVENFKANG